MAANCVGDGSDSSSDDNNSGGTNNNTKAELTLVLQFGRGSNNVEGEMNFPSGLALDSDGYVYACNDNTPMISKFDGEGNFITRWTVQDCLGMDTDNDNNVYVASTQRHKIIKYSSDGTFIREWGGLGIDNGYFYLPKDVAVNRTLNRVYVMDSMNFRIQVFDTDGNFLFKWGDNSLFGGYEGPFGIAVDQNNGDVYVANTGQAKVQKFDLDGNFLLQWGKDGGTGGSGAGNGEFRWPRGIDVDLDGNIYVADTDNERIQKFSSDGAFVTTFQGLHDEINGAFHPRAVVVNPKNISDPDDNVVYAAAAYAKRIDKFDSSGAFIKTWGYWEKDQGVFNGPQGMTIDLLHDYLYVADTNNFIVQKFDTSGSFIASWGYSDRVFAKINGGDGSFDFIKSLTTDTDGNIYVLRLGAYYCCDDPEYKRVQLFDMYGSFSSSFNYPDLGMYMYGITYNPSNGYLYISNSQLNKIECFNVDGTFVFEFGTEGIGDGELIYPSQLAVDRSNGNIYVVDVGNSRIQKFSADGQFLNKWGEYGIGDGEFIVDSSSGIFVDDHGHVYVADSGNRRIQVFDSDGNFLVTWGTKKNEFSKPSGIVVDSKGYIFVLDTWKQTVLKYTPMKNY